MPRDLGKLHWTQAFLEAYHQLPLAIQKKTDRQLQMLAENITHPSLRVKKMTNVGDIWEARIDRRYRMTFERCDDVIHLRALGRHDIYSHP